MPTPREQPHVCASCGFDLRGISRAVGCTVVCPECGIPSLLTEAGFVQSWRSRLTAREQRWLLVVLFFGPSIAFVPLLATHVVSVLLLSIDSYWLLLSGLIELVLAAAWVGVMMACPLGWAARWRSDGYARVPLPTRLVRALLPLAANALVVAGVVLALIALHT